MARMAPIADERRKPRFGTVVATIFGLLLLYVLSIGPAFVMHARGAVPEEIIDVVYFPIFWLAVRSATAKEVLYGYMELFLNW